ncbi:non-homologous end-joining factor 1 isoform X2 [Cyprinodon tularosa]|uniref:non-homologous end-joining factor 1 isoform X2 n=1 Tax=Cyprinodon tularosa TaxID=77115 RepID=UPI0018E251B5|nr:non-homologous end-joining factor 1 isoform X2 [Cyprinodon tularosa]
MNPQADPAEDALLQHPWLPVTIDGVQLLSKPWFGETAYRILLTDMQSVWEEKIEAAAVEKRAQELNRRLRASAAAFFSHLCEVAQPCLSGGQQTGGEVQMSVNRQQDGDLTLRLKSELAGLPFYWEFRCSPAPVALVCAHLVRPLLAMSRLLQSHVEQLEDLLFRKDEEIQDYQENGATLSRERLQTEVFDKQTYSEDFIQKSLPLLCSQPSDAFGFSADLQRLYGAIVAHRGARKRKWPEETGAEQNQPSTEAAAQTLTPDIRSVEDEQKMGDANQTSREEDEPNDRRNSSSRAAQTKSALVTARPAERQASKPKKKKVGLFR